MRKSEIRNPNIKLNPNVEYRMTNLRPGFTLIELLVSIAIFTIFLSVVSVSYIGIIRSQRQANEVRKMYSEVRGFVESLEEDMRLGTIDYGCYKAPLAPAVSALTNPCPFTFVDLQSPDEAAYLAIVNKDQTKKVVYWFDSTNSKLKIIRYDRPAGSDAVDVASWPVTAGYEDGRDVFSENLKMANVTFVVNPALNPYAQENYVYSQFQFQPKVTMAMTVENADKKIAPFHLDFQTTLSSRVYSRTKS